MGLFSVYKHTAPNGKAYIGITSKKPENRWNHGKGYAQNKHFTRSINLYGWDSFKHEILYTGLSKDEACEKEKELIKQYRTNDPKHGYNKSTGGENPAQGVQQSEEAVRKRVLAIKGHKRGPCKAISDAKKGKGNGKTGLLGKECGQAKQIFQMDMNGKVIDTFFGIGEIGRMLGYKSPSKIGDVCRGKRKSAYGYRWKYAEV